MESKGIDIILGMDWLSKHKVLINYSKKSMKLTTPDGKELEFVAELVVTAKVSHPVLRPNQMLIVCMPRIKLSYIRSECKHRIPMSLL